ncbi:MAG: hypothetical protein IJE16_00250 [Ruminococcus sp.]|nr:hypothetical protein [Ruminococcus sp.]
MLKKLLVAGCVVFLVINLCRCNSESVHINKPSIAAETVVSSSSESKSEATSITHSKQVERKSPEKNTVETVEKQESVTENKVSKGNERIEKSESKAFHQTEKQKSNNKNSTKSEEKDTPTTSKPKTETQKETVKSTTKKEKPTQAPKPKPTEAKKEPSVNISYYVGYAQSYASNVGLSLDSSAVDCWDNPISVNANRSGIESDIMSRLNRYRNIEGFTSVWIWYEQISSSEYNLYIGYA